jgi:hypothetical protein
MRGARTVLQRPPRGARPRHTIAVARICHGAGTGAPLAGPRPEPRRRPGGSDRRRRRTRGFGARPVSRRATSCPDRAGPRRKSRRRIFGPEPAGASPAGRLRRCHTPPLSQSEPHVTFRGPDPGVVGTGPAMGARPHPVGEMRHSPGVADPAPLDAGLEDIERGNDELEEKLIFADEHRPSTVCRFPFTGVQPTLRRSPGRSAGAKAKKKRAPGWGPADRRGVMGCA